MKTFDYFPSLLTLFYLAVFENLSALFMLIECLLLQCVDPVQQTVLLLLHLRHYLGEFHLQTLVFRLHFGRLLLFLHGLFELHLD